jgi:hypothetical protein
MEFSFSFKSVVISSPSLIAMFNSTDKNLMSHLNSSKYIALKEGIDSAFLIHKFYSRSYLKIALYLVKFVQHTKRFQINMEHLYTYR